MLGVRCAVDSCHHHGENHCTGKRCIIIDILAKAQLQDLLELATQKGATYADIRSETRYNQQLSMRNGQVESLSSTSDAGIGIRVIADGGWGFASTPDLSPEGMEAAVSRALTVAHASARQQLKPVALAPNEAVIATHESYVGKDPFAVPITDQITLLQQVHEAMVQVPAVSVTDSRLTLWRNHKIFASTEGAYIDQTITQSGGGITATSRGNGDVQRRSYSDYRNAGYEWIEQMSLVERASKLATEAAQLLAAPVCPRGPNTLLVGGEMMALQIHESSGHPVELDRVLGSEDTYAGRSFITPEHYHSGNFRYGSDVVNITGDATIPHGMGSFVYDDEGVPGQRTKLIENGIFRNYLTSRETAHELGGLSNGTMRAVGWMNLPLVRMTNINLEPGDWTLEEMIRDTQSGVLVDTPKSWSLDDKRVSFHMGNEIAWLIENGAIVGMLKNPSYTAITPEFWGSCDAVAGRDPSEWNVWGSPGCAKGEPVQVVNVAHGVAPARFRNVKVGVGE